ncbi:MAG: GTP-binding protein [Deltaproteobacteria bacterium]|nr:GTP-binding protein [Deltaproteobacteria bacterium]
MKGSAESVPFTVLTGFLGAGKTTTLNRVLRAPHNLRVAVLVNELGRISIDSELILSRGDDVLELAGGCLCCKVDVKNDLWDGIVDIIERSKPDHVVLETTGIAEPQAILEGLDKLKELDAETAKRVKTAGVVCAVDAAHGLTFLTEREEARLQVECADRLLLTKLDIATEDQARAVHKRLEEINPTAERASFPDSEDGGRLLSHWLLESRKQTQRRPHNHHHHRDGQVIAACFEDDGRFLRQPLLNLVEGESDNLLRVKGFVALAGEDRRGVLQLAGGRVELELGEVWDGSPHTQLVFIGEGLDEATLRRQLWACRVES